MPQDGFYVACSFGFVTVVLGQVPWDDDHGAIVAAGFNCSSLALNIAGILRMSSVTIFQSDHFVLSTNLLLNLTFRSP